MIDKRAKGGPDAWTTLSAFVVLGFTSPRWPRLALKNWMQCQMHSASRSQPGGRAACRTRRAPRPERTACRRHPGDGVGRGGDDTLFALVAGHVEFGRRRGRRVGSAC